jgi:hypothetical protein
MPRKKKAPNVVEVHTGYSAVVGMDEAATQVLGALDAACVWVAPKYDQPVPAGPMQHAGLVSIDLVAAPTSLAAHDNLALAPALDVASVPRGDLPALLAKAKADGNTKLVGLILDRCRA